MLLSWMAYATLVGLLVYGAGAAADRAAATWDLSRRVVWVAALLVAIASPAILAIRPLSRVAIETIPATVQSPAAEADQSVTERVTHGAVPLRDAMRARVTRMLATIEPYAGRAWLIASLAWLALLLRAAIAVRRQRAHWTAVEMDGVHVLVATSVGPAVVGAVKPQVVIPRWALSLDASVRGLMLCHETEHIRARDPLLLVGALLAIAAFPWNAALWMIVRRLRLAIEIDCDRRVLRVSARQREYGELLLTVGARRSASLPFATSLAERRAFLERRIRAMTTTTPRHPRLVTAACIILAAGATTAAVRAPRPAPFLQPRHLAIAPHQQRPGERGPDSLSVAEIHALIALHHPGVLSGDVDLNTITLVVDASGNYVVSVAESRQFLIAGGGGRGGRSGGNPDDSARPGAAVSSNLVVGRARGNSGNATPVDSAARLATGVVQTQRTQWDVAGLALKTRLARLVTIAGDTMQLSVRWTGATTDSEHVFTLINSNVPATELILLNTTLLSRLVEPELVESIRTRAFAAGQLGVTPLQVFVVRMKP